MEEEDERNWGRVSGFLKTNERRRWFWRGREVVDSNRRKIQNAPFRCLSADLQVNVYILSLIFILHLLKIFIVNKKTTPHLDSIKISKK